jgi:23S rRNA (cytosine1962-C5)-methyltransferase
MSYPTIRILEGHDRRVRSGSPWLFSNELQMDRTAKALEPGSTVRLVSSDGRAMALAWFNPHSLIAARLLTRSTEATIDRAFLERRLARALAVRDRLFERPSYRLAHAEGDGLPGLVVDRFGDVCVAQLNSAGVAALKTELVGALDSLLRPGVIVLRNDSPVRELEGLPAEIEVVKGEVPGRHEVEENGLVFVADPAGGQKTGWYFDQRENRRFAARLAAGQDVLDLYSYGGGFGLAAAAAGARHVLCVDRAEPALALARESAERQGVLDRCDFEKAEAFASIDGLTEQRRRFGLVIADPPAFVRSRKDLPAGLKGYRKLARGVAGLVAEAGFLCIACCSHNVAEDQFLAETHAGIRSAGRSARLLHRAGAGPDHPVHPALPESAYLKFLVYALD